MRYKNITIDFVDDVYEIYSDNKIESALILHSTNELIEITNNIRKERGYDDLVEVRCNNNVYYNFFLVFNTRKKEISLQAVCNHGEKDDGVCYKLPMTQNEERNLIFELIECLYLNRKRGALDK